MKSVSQFWLERRQGRCGAVKAYAVAQENLEVQDRISSGFEMSGWRQPYLQSEGIRLIQKCLRIVRLAKFCGALMGQKVAIFHQDRIGGQ
jgi:hypothetical protein